MPGGSRARRVWLLLGWGLAWAGGCGRHPARATTLTLSVRADVTGFYPHPPFSYETFTFEANWGLFDGLVRFDKQFRPSPGLAARWENPDARSYVFELRPGMRFSDGRPVTAADVVDSLQRAREHPATRHFFGGVETATAQGRQRVVVVTRDADETLLYRLPWALIVPRGGGAGIPPGTGPYRLESWHPGEGFSLVRNAYFRGPPPGFEHVRFEVVPDERERLTRVLDGRTDVADSLDAARQGTLDGHPGVRMVSGTGTFVLFLMARLDRPPLDDMRVREALDVALDRSSLADRVFSGHALPAAQVVAPGIVGFTPQLRVRPPDRERARRLLREAGHASGLTLRLDGTHNRYPNDLALLREVARQLAEVGVKVEVNALDKGRFFPMLFAGESPFHMVGWACDSGEASILLHGVFRTGAPGNTMGLSDTALDHLIDAAARTERVQERVRLLQQALMRIAEAHFALPLVVPSETLVVSRRVAWEPPRNFALRYWEMAPADPPR